MIEIKQANASYLAEAVKLAEEELEQAKKNCLQTLAKNQLE